MITDLVPFSKPLVQDVRENGSAACATRDYEGRCRNVMLLQTGKQPAVERKKLLGAAVTESDSRDVIKRNDNRTT
jgi:hypothetical protein